MSLALLITFSSVERLEKRYRRALFLALPPTLLISVATWALNGFLIATSLFLLALSLIIVAASAYGLFGPVANPNPHLADFQLKDGTLPLPNPGEPGPYEVRYLTYGSGKDLHRPEYAAEASFTTRSVDASKLDQDWNGLIGYLRSAYWGFDASELPVQRRVWMPVTDGDERKAPFPLVLMVHGVGYSSRSFIVGPPTR